jgi:hypothetical protein
MLAQWSRKIQRAAAVRQPAHDDLVARQHLLAVDAQVLPRLVRPARDDQAPGDERRHVARPAVLHGQARQVHVRAFPHHLLAGGPRAHGVGRHVPQGLEQLPMPSMSLKPLGASGSLRLASSSPKARSSRTSATPMARATRPVVPNRLPSTGMCGRWAARTAGPGRPRAARGRTGRSSPGAATRARHTAQLARRLPAGP